MSPNLNNKNLNFGLGFWKILRENNIFAYEVTKEMISRNIFDENKFFIFTNLLLIGMYFLRYFSSTLIANAFLCVYTNKD